MRYKENQPWQRGGKYHLFLEREQKVRKKKTKFDENTIWKNWTKHLHACRRYVSWGLAMRPLPLACCINSDSASVLNAFDPFPVQSKEWYKFQSASAHNLLRKFGKMMKVESAK